jgi:hypothetical protein
MLTQFVAFGLKSPSELRNSIAGANRIYLIYLRHNINAVTELDDINKSTIYSLEFVVIILPIKSLRTNEFNLEKRVFRTYSLCLIEFSAINYEIRINF